MVLKVQPVLKIPRLESGEQAPVNHARAAGGVHVPAKATASPAIVTVTDGKQAKQMREQRREAMRSRRQPRRPTQ